MSVRNALFVMAVAFGGSAAFAQTVTQQPSTPPFGHWQTEVKYGPAPVQAPLALNFPPPAATPIAPTSPSAPSVPTSGTPLPAPTPPAAVSTPAPTPPVSAPEHLTTFDALGVNLSWSDHGWELVNGDKVLKDFGRRESDAREALRVIRDLHLTQYGTVGTPYPVMEYWLSEGHAPSSLAPGLRPMPLDPMSLKVEAIRGQWCLRDGQRVLFNFGQREVDARAGLEVLMKYHFNEVATIGQGSNTMLIFLGQAGREPQSSSFNSRLHPLSHHDADPNAPSTKAPAKGGEVPVMPALPQLNGAQPVDMHQHADSLTQRAESHASSAVKAPGEIGERIAFDWRQLQLRRDQGGEWKLQAGSMVFARFGNEQEGRQALHAMQYYHVNEERLLNQGGTAFYLSNGQAPRGLMFGLNSLAIQPESLEVRQVGDRWAICAGDLPVLRYGTRPDEARQMLQAIRQYHFDRLCQFGVPDGEGLTLLVRTH
jgi:hypothetical protein